MLQLRREAGKRHVLVLDSPTAVPWRQNTAAYKRGRQHQVVAATAQPPGRSTGVHGSEGPTACLGGLGIGGPPKHCQADHQPTPQP
jgi:hypothetical protein